MTDFNQETYDTDVGSHGGQSRQTTSTPLQIRRIAPASGISVRKLESRRRRQCLSYWITAICTAVQAAG